MSTKTVLIIDDDKNLCNTLEDILRDEGYNPFSVSTCAEGLMLTHSLRPDAVLLDYKLPDCSGTDLLSQIKEIKTDCFCIIITAYADVDSAVGAMEKGAFHYLRKPFSPVELLQLLKRIDEIITLRETKESTEESLRDSEEKYRTLVNNVNVGVYRNTGGPHGQFIQVNPAMIRIFEYDSMEEFLKLSASDLYQDPEERKKYIEKIRRNGSVRNEELQMKKKGGIPIWASVTARVEYDENGDIKWIDGVIDDITERKLTEEKFIESEKRYRELTDLLPQTIFEIDTQGTLIFVNRHAYETFGYTEDDLFKGFNVLHMFIPEDRERLLANIQRKLKGEESGGTEYTMIKKNGTRITVIIYSSPIIRGNSTVGIRGIIIDITERKRMEDILREINRTLLEEREIFLGGPAVVFKWKNESGWPVEYVSPNVREVFGYPSDEFIQGKILYAELIPEEDIERVSNEVTLYSKKKVHNFTHIPYRIRCKTGQLIWLYAFTTVLRDQHGNVTHYLGYVIDITAQKEAENALRDSEERYRALYENNPSMYFTVDTQGTVISVNRFGAEQLGYKVEELVGQHVLEVFYPEDRAEVLRHLKESFQEPGKILTWELRKVRKDGSIIWVRETVRALRWLDGKIMTFIVCEDINELKKADEALRESEQKYKLLTENSLTGIFIHQDGKFVFVNSKFADIHGYEKEELLGKDYLSLIYQNDRDVIKHRIKERLAGENIPQRYEMRRLHKEGKIIWTEISTTVIQFKGKPAIMGNLVDISERKQSEKEIQNRVQELEEFYDIAVGRELRIKQLTKQIEKLKEELAGYKNIQKETF